MALLEIFLQLVAVVGVMVGVAAATLVGRDRLAETRRTLRTRLERNAVPLGALAVILAINSIVRDVGVDLSWLFGVNVTGLIYELEGGVVPFVQSFATPELTLVFSFVYVFGYTFLLVFPLVAYLAIADPRPLRKTTIAYGVNYSIGLVCYILFIAYGPRNYIPGLTDSLLYTFWPQAQTLTSQVNANTNVFPSLHTSLSFTVILLAVRMRDHYPRWVYVATPLGVGVAISTMYLGIHWAIDVLLGIVLAVLAVGVAEWLTE